MSGVYISNICTWPEKKSIENYFGNIKENSKAAAIPRLEFTPPMFRRRLSTVSKITIQTIHDLIEKYPKAISFKQIFISLHGEIQRQFEITSNLLENKEVLPAAFSLSVFNTPIALASIALKLKSGYSVIYPEQNNFSSAIKAAFAPVICGQEENIILVYADEIIPEKYMELHESNIPFAFAAAAGRCSAAGAKYIYIEKIDETAKSPAHFLKYLLEE